MSKDDRTKGAELDPYITAIEVARLCNVSTKSVYRWVDTGAVPAYRAGKHLRFKRGEIETYLARDTRQPSKLASALCP